MSPCCATPFDSAASSSSDHFPAPARSKRFFSGSPPCSGAESLFRFFVAFFVEAAPAIGAIIRGAAAPTAPVEAAAPRRRNEWCVPVVSASPAVPTVVIGDGTAPLVATAAAVSSGDAGGNSTSVDEGGAEGRAAVMCRG